MGLNIFLGACTVLGIIFAFGSPQLDRRRSGSYIAAAGIIALGLVNVM